MTTCQDIEAHLGDFFSGELDAAEKTAVEQHLSGCEACKANLAFLKGFREKLAEAEKTEYPQAVHARLLTAISNERTSAPSNVVSLSSVRKAPVGKGKLGRYMAAASLLCALGLGLTQFHYASATPEAVIALVDHHDTCFHIEPSPGRDAQFDKWVTSLNGMPKAPTVSSELVAYDQRECPAGEVRAGHLMYKKEQKLVSVYILPANRFLESYGSAQLADYAHAGREVVLVRKGDWVYGMVAALPADELRRLVDTEHLALLRAYLAQTASPRHG